MGWLVLPFQRGKGWKRDLNIEFQAPDYSVCGDPATKRLYRVLMCSHRITSRRWHASGPPKRTTGGYRECIRFQLLHGP